MEWANSSALELGGGYVVISEGAVRLRRDVLDHSYGIVDRCGSDHHTMVYRQGESCYLLASAETILDSGLPLAMRVCFFDVWHHVRRHIWPWQFTLSVHHLSPSIGQADSTFPVFCSWMLLLRLHVADGFFQRWPKFGPVTVSNVMLPIIYQYSAWMSVGVNSTITSSIVVGLVSQLWLRQYHPGWYKKYNYILGGALDGGAQSMIFMLSFAVFGASGKERPFPSVRSSVSCLGLALNTFF